MTRDDTPEVQAKRRKQHWEQILISITVIIAGLTVVSTTFFNFKADRETQSVNAFIENKDLEKRVVQLAQILDDVKSANQKISEQVKGAPPGTAQIASLNAEVGSLENQVKALNDAIGQTPDKALAVPLLRKDVDNLRESYRQDLGSTQAEINRVYDQNKWFIGLMFTMAVGLLTLAISNFLQLRKP